MLAPLLVALSHGVGHTVAANELAVAVLPGPGRELLDLLLRRAAKHAEGGPSHLPHLGCQVFILSGPGRQLPGRRCREGTQRVRGPVSFTAVKLPADVVVAGARLTLLWRLLRRLAAKGVCLPRVAPQVRYVDIPWPWGGLWLGLWRSRGHGEGRAVLPRCVQAILVVARPGLQLPRLLAFHRAAGEGKGRTLRRSALECPRHSVVARPR
mmetsp:Transcript_39590/g.100431  ORF Transcript_39590/g.100431 Transcript_39590/m.100431 type:complete len:210 (+) Transcript_39590:90-719(+)